LQDNCLLIRSQS